ncbi:DUF47 domain-containing protein [Winogradskyella aquimaris]|uniref:DUF47 family protein n=1 Tax=Winogradskyella aquimaris TaxID=864074 RepID=A0ABU5EJ57_9FLAO|nr:hypothetical protein [Winogradskyella aquimaris]MDY2586375.1 hypothetical protein [Winogradskyella aquimaris]
MNLKKITQWILPNEIDFFGNLLNQSKEIEQILAELNRFYSDETSTNPGHLLELINQAKSNHSKYLKELNSTFIIPVDREALSRAFSQLYWIVLSVKHLIVEIDTYKIYHLNEYHHIFRLLEQGLSELTNGFEKLREKNYLSVKHNIENVIHLDNKLIKAYSVSLSKLFHDEKFPKILMQKEILFQLREISKQIHICANLLEDIIFKVN